MLECLAFMLLVYALEIKHEIVNIYMIKRNLKYARVDMEIKEYSFAWNMGQVMSELIDDLSKIFITITLEISPCTYACAKSLSRSQYTDTKLKNWGKCQTIHTDCWHLHASAFERYTTDVENIHETYAHYADEDEDEDSLDDNGRTSTKPFHTLGRTPAPATPATKDARKDKKGRGDHCQPQEQHEPTKHNQSEPGSSHTVNAGSVADPGFPIEGGHQPLTWALFGNNVCENERIGSCWGGAHTGGTP